MGLGRPWVCGGDRYAPKAGLGPIRRFGALQAAAAATDSQRVKDRIVARFGRHLAQLVRYAAVSAIATSVSLTILGTLVATRAVTAGWANVIAAAVATVPSFELNRRWVWSKRGRRSLLKEAAPYFALTFAGLGLSTLAVSTATGAASAHHVGTAGRTVVAMFANLSGFGTVWIVQYVVLDRVLFRRPAGVPATPLEPRLVAAEAA
jgi:putative flippase GtrA